jgi:hypothetical protein
MTVELNPTAIVKAYIRKSHILFTMKDYVKAIQAVQEASDHDADKAHAKEIQDQIWKCQQAQFSQTEGESDEDVMQRAMRDPEIAVSFCVKVNNHFWISCIFIEYYDRPCHAINSTTGSEQPSCASRSHEEPRRSSKNQQTN